MIGKKLHRDMAEVNVYTAKRLREMACSLSGLARAFTDEAGSGRRLSFAIICTTCSGLLSRRAEWMGRTCLACLTNPAADRRSI